MVSVVDFGWFGSVGPGQAAIVGDDGLVVTVGCEAVVGGAGEEQCVGVGGAACGPVRAVVNLAVTARLKAIRAGAAAVAGKTVSMVYRFRSKRGVQTTVPSGIKLGHRLVKPGSPLSWHSVLTPLAKHFSC